MVNRELKDKCMCGKNGIYLNTGFGKSYGKVLCESCKDKARIKFLNENE